MFETKSKGPKNRKMFYGPLEKLQFDLIVWKWVNQEKLMRYTTKHTRKMLKPNRQLVHNILELCKPNIPQISKCGGRIFG